jgi:hypothetical protein
VKSGLELPDSRVSNVEVIEGVVTIYFSNANIHKSRGTPGRDEGTEWAQEARLVFTEVDADFELPALPATVADGYLEVGGIRHTVIPLPFKRKVAGRLFLTFMDGSELEISGLRPYVELGGRPIEVGAP